MPVYHALPRVPRQLKLNAADQTTSVLSRYKDDNQFPELCYVGRAFADIRIYREWNFGRDTTPRLPQRADLPNWYLYPDASNLGLVLNKLAGNPQTKKELLSALHCLYPNIDDVNVQVESGTVRIFFHEGSNSIPATRLSDGTLRYLCLLAILCNPNPGKLVCIEEPELGLHPDVLPSLARLMQAAAERTQLIVTTHSETFVDAFHDQPDAVVVVERDSKGTHLERLNPDELKVWLDKYRLGDLWMRGKLGGTRW